jgi:hypothetical protein
MLPEDLPGDHVEDAAGRADDNVLARVQLPHVLPDACAADAGVALRPHVVAQGHHHLLNLLGQLTGRGQDQRLKHKKCLNLIGTGIYLLLQIVHSKEAFDMVTSVAELEVCIRAARAESICHYHNRNSDLALVSGQSIKKF